MTEFWVVRHGQSTWNADGRYQGQADVPLSEIGFQQSQALAARLGALATGGLHFDAIYTSDLLRASQTAVITATCLGLEVCPDPRLREIHVGELSGLLREEIERDYPMYMTHLQADPWATRRPGGESMQDLFMRCRAVFSEYTERHSGGRVLVFTHGGVVRVGVGLAFSGLQGDPVGTSVWSRLSVANTSVTRLLLAPGEGSLLCFNDEAHLESTTL